MSMLAKKLESAINSADYYLVKSLLDVGASIKYETFDALKLAISLNLKDIAGLISITQKKLDKLINFIIGNEYNKAKEYIHHHPYLLSAVENVHGPDWTILMYAVKSGDINVVKLCLEKGSNPHCNFGASSMNALTIAIYHEHNEIVHLLEDLNVISSDITNFIYAASMGDLNKVKSFIENGMDVNAKDSCKHCALSSVFFPENEELVDYLLKEGADVNKSNNWGGWIWFQEYIKNGDIESVKRILDLGYNVNHMDEWGNTCMKYAENSNQLQIKELLIEYGAMV